jgi:magnesium transporter
MNDDDDQPIQTTTRITPDANVDRIYSDIVDYDSYIYGDAEATPEDTFEIMNIYDPDSERYEDIDVSSVDEIVNCYAYSRKTGEQLEQVALGDVSKALTNN